MGNSFGKTIAGLGAVMAGYAKGKMLYDDREFEKEKQGRERQKWKDEDELRQVMGGLSNAPAKPAEQPISLIDGSPIQGPDAYSSDPEDPNIKRPMAPGAGTNGTLPTPGLQAVPGNNPAGAPSVPEMTAGNPPVQPSPLEQGVVEQDRHFAQGQRVAETRNEIESALDRRGAGMYLRNKAPAIIDTYLKQGNLEGAKRFRDFVDSEEGRNYTHAWAKGARKLAIGDYQGALGTWEKLYNDQLYPDGNHAKMTPSQDGKQVRVDQFDRSGTQISTRTMPLADMARQAGVWLAPEKLVEFQAQQQAKRDSEAAALDKSLQLEELRQQGQEVREDRRDDRTRQQIEASDRRHAASLAAQAQRGGLTQAQERGNTEINAARESIAGMTPQEIARRTAKATNTGRENPDYDPGLARQVSLAGRRKIGTDDWFDQRQPRESAPAREDDIPQRFGADPQMKGMKLGHSTDKGREVFDASGRMVGYYR